MGNKEFFDEAAGQWAEFRKTLYSEAVRERALDVAGVQSGRIAADVGSGTGFITEGLIRRGLEVYAIDESEAMLRELQKLHGASGRVTCLRGESEHLPLEDSSVDYVLANMYLHHVERPFQAIQEMVRILRPGGRIAVTGMDEHRHEFLRVEHHDRWLGFARPDVRRWFESAALSSVEVEDLGESCCTTSVNTNEVATIRSFVATGPRFRQGENPLAERKALVSRGGSSFLKGS